MKQDYSMNDDGGCECLHCMMVSTKEQVTDGDRQHWDDCEMLINDDDTDPQGDK